MDLKQLVKKAIAETGSFIEENALLAFILVESSGKGFNGKRLVIQFEPHKFEVYDNSGQGTIWPHNKIDIQSKEWEAFNEAFKINPEAAMLSTSIGLPQIMGFHWKRLGYRSVGDMWDDFKVGELNQIKALIRFIETDSRLKNALISKDWHSVASIYNGKFYREQAKRIGREPYDISFAKVYEKLNQNK